MLVEIHHATNSLNKQHYSGVFIMPKTRDATYDNHYNLTDADSDSNATLSINRSSEAYMNVTFRGDVVTSNCTAYIYGI